MSKTKQKELPVFSGAACVKELPGLSREAEEKQLTMILGVAQENLERTQRFVKMLYEDLKDIQENYEVSDKETLVLWNTAEAQLTETKRDLVRNEKARKKPYFGRIDFKDPAVEGDEAYYIGRVGISKDSTQPLVIDWRAPLASVYYESNVGPCTYAIRNEGSREIELKRKRTYEIADDKLKDFFDSDVVANDELLTKYLAKNKKAVLGEIIATIQQEQNAIIRKSPKTNLIVQGVAGSGKTTVAMHRISYILYNYENEFRPQDFYIVGSNRILLNYITGVLPDLDVYGVSQMTMEELFVRLLYEDWDRNKYCIKPLDKKNELSCIKGSSEWFFDLERFCSDYENQCICKDEVHMEKTGTLLMGPKLINTYLENNPTMSMQSKINMLNEILTSSAENEIQGKNVSFTAREKQALLKKYGMYYGKDEWKGSIFDLYERFLIHQSAQGKSVDAPAKTKSGKTAFDVYDLAALAYLYKRIKETDGIREASHVVIDEAQDFGMMAYQALYYCLRGCTYTIMGDVSQNIHFGYGLNDWEELKKLILTGPFDSFELLRKSYRNTVEISNFATEILRHGQFAIYPVEPIVRHGNEVQKIRVEENDPAIFRKTAEVIRGWQEQGYETIAVVCRDEEEVQQVSTQLQKEIPILNSDLTTMEFDNGVMVLSVEYTKGLEFDAVLLFDPTEEHYPTEDGYVKLLYVAATRALHELVVIYRNAVTDLIGKAVEPDKRMEALANETGSRVKRFENRPLTTRQQQVQDIIDNKKERARRGYIGPKPVRTDDLKKKPEKVLTAKEMLPATAKDVVKPEKTTEAKPATQPVISDRIVPSSHAFFDMPDTSVLTVKGHSRNDHIIRWMNKTKQHVELTSQYGVLRITPLSSDRIRIQFRKGQIGDFTEGCFVRKPDKDFKWTAKDERVRLVLQTDKIKVVVEKQTGAVQFFNVKTNALLLQEKATEPRLVEADPRPKTWTFFDWGKKEKLKAKGIGKEDYRPVSGKANYISFGGQSLRMPVVVSDRGYRLEVAAQSTVLFCNVAAYGSYIYMEDQDQIDYDFIMQ